MARVQDFTRVYTRNQEVDSLDEVLRQPTASDCADATLGWGRSGYVRFSREAFDHDAAVAQAVARIAQILTGVSLVRTEAGAPQLDRRLLN